MHLGRPYSIYIASAAWLLMASVRAAVPAAEYDAAIYAARSGDTGTALAKLNEWHRNDPKDLRIVYDLAAVLDMAGQHEAALQYYGKVVQAEAPPYAIKSVAHSARAAGKAKEAEAAYQLLLTKTPDDAEAHAGLAYAWLSQGQDQAALDHIKSRLPATTSSYTRRDAPLIVALAEAYETRKEWIPAAAMYQEVLRLEPNFRYALRGRVFALNNAGAFHLARRLAESRPEAFTVEERSRLAYDASARTVLFGKAQLEADDTPGRFAATDLALKQNEDTAKQFGPTTRNSFDRVVALSNRVRTREAIELYESLLEQKVAIPPYVRAAAADAYLEQRQPERARDLYLSVLNDAESAKLPDAFDWQIALLYAYGEAEQHREAEELADRLLAGMPAYMNKGVAAVEAPNDEYARSALMAALVRLYADRAELAEQRLAELRALAPFNHDIRSSWALLQLVREHPRASLEEYALLQADYPESVEAGLGHAEGLVTLNRLDDANVVFASVQENYPDRMAVQVFKRELDSHDAYHLQVDTVIGRGAENAGAESVFDAILYSPPLTKSIGTPYRAFVRVNRAEGDADDESVSRTRYGIGMDYRLNGISTAVELNHASGDADRDGVAASVSVGWSDQWRSYAKFDSNVNDLAAAAYRDGVTGRSLSLGTAWTKHESRMVGAEIAQTRFSDDNTRYAARLWWTERWISGPIFKLSTTAAFSASRNSETDTSYFNPERDREATVTMVGEWLGWRRYENAFRQRVSFTAGHYSQKGYSGGEVGDLRYEHEWRMDPTLYLLYGIGHSLHPYDGEREHRNYAYLSLYWRMK
ncbi:MAG TPA: poly-beta-1,6 N-acetyl-D-glucosamine export porin PgaA [Noviherbaspirillum sp.]|nr:poly-beta-1,6 N-acetyl-D-glucosamine export porin PgaA [Noviherbaspirillum sp.]